MFSHDTTLYKFAFVMFGKKAVVSQLMQCICECLLQMNGKHFVLTLKSNDYVVIFVEYN